MTFANEAWAEAESAEHGRRALVLNHIARDLTESLDPATIGGRIVAAARSLFGVDYAVLRLLREDGSLVAFAVSDVAYDHVQPGHVIPPGMGIVARALSSGTPVWSPDVQREEGIIRTDEMQDRLTSSGIRGLLAVPLRARGRIIGTFDIADRTPRTFSAQEVILLETFADHAALALENARLYADRERLLREAETARASAEAATRAKDAFLATLSHELRTPLSSILSWIRALRSGRLPPDRVAAAYGSIERNAAIELRLVDELLDITRIVAGKIDLAKRPTDVVEAAEQAMATVDSLAEGKGITLERRVDGPLPRVFADPVRLQQIFVNILSNAIKFTPAAGRVMMGLATEAGVVRVRIADTGCGIAPDFLPNVFIAYRQASDAPARSRGGLGLGLAIVKHLVTLHGGTIRAESAGKDLGAAFIIELPALAVEETVEELSRMARVAERSVGPPGRLASVHAVIVDDSEDARELLRIVLEYGGAKVSVAASVSEAIRIISESSIDVVVSDIHMPDRSGIEFMEDLRAWEVLHQRPPIPVIALSADARLATQEAVLRAGFDGCLWKPIDPAELVAAVVRALRLPGEEQRLLAG